MLDEILVRKLKDIYNKLTTLSDELICLIDHLDKKADPDISVYITGMKKCRLAFKKSLEVLEHSNEFYKKDLEINQDRTLDTIRHDMINPVSGLKGYSELILEKSCDQYVLTNTEKIISIIDNILSLIYLIKTTD